MKWLNQLFGGSRDMTALPAGSAAPDFSLTATDGSKFSLQDALQQGPVLLAFFKVSCPVCQYAFPYFERVYQAQKSGKTRMVAISQNNKSDTAAFLKEYGVTFPTLLDDPNGYKVSNAYGLTNVPTLFLIAPSGEIEVSSVGWVKQDLEDIHRRLSEAGQTTPAPIFKAGDDVREYRPG